MVERRLVPMRDRSIRGRAQAARPQLSPLYIGICACLGAGVAQGQAPAQPTPQLEEVLVTGSRIVRRDLDASSPILTVESEAFDMTSNIAIESTLNQYPQFNPGATQ